MNAPTSIPLPLRILLAPFGSEGDVAPMLWLADQLQARGHRVRVAANVYHQPLIQARGYDFYPAGDADKLREVLEDESTWDGMKGSQRLLKNLISSLPGCAEPFLQYREPVDLIVGTTFALGAHTAAEARGIPFVRLHLQPSLLRSVGDLPVLGEGLGWMKRLPPFAIRGFFKLVDRSIDGEPMRKVNEYRASLKLPPLASFYWDVCNGGDGLAALFPEWFAPRQPDWPHKLRQFDFPLTAEAATESLPPRLEAFLAAGEAPVVWTHGSANFHTDEFDALAERCCRKLGVRGVVVGPRIPEAGDERFLRLRYAPFSSLFPRCRALVHHGGIGTTTKGLQAGLPQLIVPRAFDQFDNAARAERLGFAKTLGYSRRGQIPQVLKALLAAQSCSARATELGRTLRPPVEAVSWLETIAAKRRKA